MSAEPQTLNELFNFAVDRHRGDEFLRFKSRGEWRSLTYGDVARRVRELALGLHALGFKSRDRIAIWSENRPEWNIADLAVLALGAADVPIYTTQARDQVEYILADSGARAIFVSSAFIDQALALKDRVKTVELVICFDALSFEADPAAITTVEDVVGRGRALYGEEPNLHESMWRSVKAEDLATLLYTSGTTGDPKGVMLTHKNLTANARNCSRWLKLEGRRELALTYLPFTHVFERAVWYLYAHTGATIAYAESIEAVAANLQEVRPTAMTSVPRMFEKIYSRIIEKGMAAGFPRRQIFLWSLDVGRDWAQRKDKGAQIGALLSIKHKVADALVFKKWRAAVGGNVRIFISGGAPLAPEIAY
ncbi:MAG TPA: AMP-binding protein, partial [Blastocatellia bacterium]|nr:AMP-binding protein [Blastocatellia bacterium]